ncbi:MAG: DUF4012 domain-containing protein [Candidatus Moranbacteria bacterium]|nr:DUF4012 domain-containing protein [Candidatus Moranbacteria bacterium]
MKRKNSGKILVIFWILAVLGLAGWFAYLQIHYRNLENLKPLVSLAPISAEKKEEARVLMDILSATKDEKTFLLLFQNNLELRPGGGFIGSFGILKTKNGKIEDIRIFDTGNFDKNVPLGETPPEPFREILGYENWKMRDSNWSPDFAVNAKKAEYFYHLGGGKEEIDGVAAINTDVLDTLLSVTGPVKIDGYPGEYRDENAILQLEYQVEKGYVEQGIAKEERKNIMKELAEILSEKARNLTFSEQFTLAEKLEERLKEKDIQLFFKDENLQKEIDSVGWGGEIRESESDYLFIVDANMNALKTDYCIRRKVEYAVDFSAEKPEATLNITYKHACRTKDWMTSDYRDWLRVYVPQGSRLLVGASGQSGEAEYPEESGKSVFGMLVKVPVGETKTVTLKYVLPENIDEKYYALLAQKQSGSGELPLSLSVKQKDGKTLEKAEILNTDKEFGL